MVQMCPVALNLCYGMMSDEQTSPDHHLFSLIDLCKILYITRISGNTISYIP